MGKLQMTSANCGCQVKSDLEYGAASRHFENVAEFAAASQEGRGAKSTQIRGK